MTTYRVKDWDTHFENDRSRERDKCSFVCVPNKRDGLGFCRIISEADGAALYGIWLLIVSACSRQARPREGWLTANGKPDGPPWTAGDLALMFRRPVAEVERAFQVLSSPGVDWLLTSKPPTTPDEPPTHPPPTPLEEKGREGKGKKEDARARFFSPSLEAVKLQAAKIGLPDSRAEVFFNFYESNGWKVGRNPMRNWKAALSNWKERNDSNNNHARSDKPNSRNAGLATDPAKQGRDCAAAVAADNKKLVPNTVAAKVAQPGLLPS